MSDHLKWTLPYVQLTKDELRRHWETNFGHTPQEIRAYELVEQYYINCEAYDRTVCTGPITRDGILPIDHRELGKINRNAHDEWVKLSITASYEGISSTDLKLAKLQYLKTH
jgi:hypothetical protein